ncbi:hypothetical protein CMI37_09375 [Candidatus Pacearchaeota archaeon]|nr:hypothetical protein [Candidatus Pacearchaeota archaeon]
MVYNNSDMEWYDWILLYLLGAYGVVYTFLPHSLHVKGFAVDWLLFETGFQHSTHVLIGIVFLFLTALYFSWRKGFIGGK